MLSFLLEENPKKGYRDSCPCHLLSNHTSNLSCSGLLLHSAPHLAPATMLLPLCRRLLHTLSPCPGLVLLISLSSIEIGPVFSDLYSQESSA